MRRPVGSRCEWVVAQAGSFAKWVMRKTNHNVSWTLPITLKPSRRCRNDREALVGHQGGLIERWRGVAQAVLQVMSVLGILRLMCRITSCLGWAHVLAGSSTFPWPTRSEQNWSELLRSTQIHSDLIRIHSELLRTEQVPIRWLSKIIASTTIEPKASWYFL